MCPCVQHVLISTSWRQCGRRVKDTIVTPLKFQWCFCLSEQTINTHTHTLFCSVQEFATKQYMMPQISNTLNKSILIYSGIWLDKCLNNIGLNYNKYIASFRNKFKKRLTQSSSNKNYLEFFHDCQYLPFKFEELCYF